MRIAVLEVVTAGFFGPDPEPSLRSEGLAMWSALITDLAALPDTQVITVLEQQCQTVVPASCAVDCRIAQGPVEAAQQWATALQDADSALVIAPEFSELLRKLVEAMPQHVTVWNAAPDTIDVCSDKLRLCEHLQQRRIPTIATCVVDWSHSQDFSRGSSVIKPRDGAGSYLVRRVSNQQAWFQVREEYAGSTETQALLQPYIPGRSLSIAGWFSESGTTVLPIAEQHLSAEGEFRYLGGQIPADMTDQERKAVTQLFRDATESLPGLRGYIGADVILPDDDPLAPVLVEINPRFTTSYVGYRRAWSQSPWPQWLQQQPLSKSLSFAAHTVRFQADGTVAEVAP